MIGQVERWVAGQSLPAVWRPLLETIQQTVARSVIKPSKSVVSLLEHIRRLSSDSVVSRLKADNGWADQMAQDLATTNAVARQPWDAFLSHASTVAPEPPAKEWDVEFDEFEADLSDLDAREAERDKRLLGRRASSAWTDTSLQRTAAIGVEPFLAQRLKWLHAVPNSKPSTLSQFSVNREILRGILCTCEHYCDAELASAVRVAPHVLKQSQFCALAKTRRWTASYLGHWDGGDHGISERRLPEWQLRAEHWTLGAGDDFTNGYTYVTTDQVRFSSIDSPDPLPLEQVPPLVFSEVSRDVDLFVAVASVGNDADWQDGGPDGRHAAYWQSYSFGALSESALTRRAALERIIPQLTIADRCTFSDRFLVVRGDRRTYRIHLGSGNILMEPDNCYLCIVPTQGPKTGGKLYLPFEADNRLSVILSKALLLADDASITNPSIVRQIVAG